MQTFLMGTLGALSVIGLLAVGVFLGWKAHAMFVKHTAYKPQEPNEQLNKKLIQDQKAFDAIKNYSVERAYGLVDDEENGGAEY